MAWAYHKSLKQLIKTLDVKSLTVPKHIFYLTYLLYYLPTIRNISILVLGE